MNFVATIVLIGIGSATASSAIAAVTTAVFAVAAFTTLTGTVTKVVSNVGKNQSGHKKEEGENSRDV
ncbi:unnamed protein product [Cochlearia groenlandica]